MTILELKKQIVERAKKITFDGDYIIFDKNTPDFNVTDNFKLSEFLTRNTKDTYTKINLGLIIELQKLRVAWGSGIGINSSYRSPEYNKSIGGASKSEHINGNAFDTYPINKDIKRYSEFIKKNKKTGGRGYYKTFVHIDVGQTREWNG